MDSSKRLVTFFSNPTIGIAGSLASIAGVLLAVYFYQAGQRSRDLRYFVHPARAVVVKAGQSSRLQVTVDGARVDNDVTAAQVAFWNEGKDPVRSQHMLHGLVIRIAPKSQILDASLRKVSRDVTSIALDLSRIKEGEVGVNWAILERNDGGILQLIYAGDTTTDVVATATIEGQGDVRRLQYSGSPEQYQKGNYKIFGYIYLGIALAMGAVATMRISKRKGAPMPSFMKWTFLGAPLLVLGMGLFILFWIGAKPGPPFGFE